MKIESCIAKSKELEKTSITYRDHSKKLKNQFKNRRRTLCIIVSLIVLIAIALVILILVFIV